MYHLISSYHTTTTTISRTCYSDDHRYSAMQQAQEAVTLYDEFRNNTIYVPTAKFMNYDGNDTYDAGYHYDGRADVYTHIGRALGHGMLKLMGKVASNERVRWAKLERMATSFQKDEEVGSYLLKTSNDYAVF